MTIRDQVFMNQNKNKSLSDFMNNRTGNNSSTNRSFGSQGASGIPDMILRQFKREADRLNGTLNNLQTVSRNAPERSTDEQIKAVRRVVNSFNDMLSSAKEKGGRSVTRLEQELVNLVRDNPDELKRMGISVNRDGSIRMNHAKVRSAIEKGDINRIVNSSNRSGFVSSLSATASAVSRNPGVFLVISSYVRPQNMLQRR